MHYQIKIGHFGVTISGGNEIQVTGIDADDRQVMDQFGTWHDVDDVDFPTYDGQIARL
jgi:hypothetical protein